MKKTLIGILLLFVGAVVYSQVERAEPLPGPGRPVAESIGADTAQQKLKEVSLSKFEDAGFWQAVVSLDDGVVSARRLEGGSAAKKPIPAEEAIGIREEDKYVLGVKTEFFRRSNALISVSPTRPLAIAGVVKTHSVWVVGRNFNHTLKARFEDFAGRRFELEVGKLNFVGWKQMVVAIPPTVEQRNPHYGILSGIKFLGFSIDCDLMEAYGSYYIYLDDLRAVTDLFGEENRDQDDMIDAW